MKIHHILWIQSLLYCCRLTAKYYYAILDCDMMSINWAILKTKWDEHMPDIIFTSLESVTWSCVLDIELSLLVSTNFLVCPSCHITVQYGSWSWWIKGFRRWATNHHTRTKDGYTVSWTIRGNCMLLFLTGFCIVLSCLPLFWFFDFLNFPYFMIFQSSCMTISKDVVHYKFSQC